MDQANNSAAPPPRLPKRNTRIVILAIIALVLLIGLGIYYMSTVGADIVDSRTVKTVAPTTTPTKSKTSTSSLKTKTATPIAVTATPTTEVK